MLSDGESIIFGHQEKPMEPEKQIDFLRRCLRGEKTPYSNPNVIVAVARIAIMKAVKAVYITGEQKGQRQYNNLEIEKMNAEADRLERLLKRKNNGENIEMEIDGPLSGEEIDEQKQEPETVKNIEPPPDIPETVQIKVLIDEAVDYCVAGNTNKANKKFEEAIERIKKAKSEGVDVTDLELQIKDLRTFFK